MRCQNVSCNSTDLRALIRFSNFIEWGLDWSSSESNCCTWTGVTCDNSTISSKRVVRLELGAKKLVGKLSESLADLDQLRILNVSHNLLRGYLPGKLFGLQKLEILDLSNNYFVGPIPGGSDLPLIRYVDISKNNFNGTLYATIFETSPHFQVLNLANNYFTGEVPASFGSCYYLQHLFLDGNDLTGNFPESLLQLRDLHTLNIQDNLFLGSLNEGISNLSNLVKLDVSFNRFSGILPDVFESLGKLEHFSARSNMFYGHLPKSLVNSPSIITLDLSSNALSGIININCSAMLHLSSLSLGANQFCGPVPESISSCQRLSNLNLGRNNLSGEVPYAFKDLQALTSISLSNSSLVNISSALAILQHCKNLTSLFLGDNFHDEQMPRNMNLHFRNLKTLVIPHCGLKGQFPIWLGSSKMLQLLDISWNQMTGTIPSGFHEFKFLFYMDLSHNSFTGEIPVSLTELEGLIKKNVSEERPSLGFPLFKARNMYKQISSFRPTLDLSYNKLSGLIWPSFGNLKELHVLNLKDNHLSGNIPDSLSGMTNLEVLDLSQNELSGEIPLSLEKLSFLARFSVASNQLHGEIPRGGQFLTFPSPSFEGNKGLFSDNVTPRQPQPADEEMTIIGLQFGFGAVTGFLLTVSFCFLSGWVFRK
jgi:Leucine-rich repeat (LRR) protein